MTERQEGYLQALKDVKLWAQTALRDRAAQNEGKPEYLTMVSYLDSLIAAKEGRAETHGEQDAPDPISGSF